MEFQGIPLEFRLSVVSGSFCAYWKQNDTTTIISELPEYEYTGRLVGSMHGIEMRR